jgi:hypothetical protein
MTNEKIELSELEKEFLSKPANHLLHMALNLVVWVLC